MRPMKPLWTLGLVALLALPGCVMPTATQAQDNLVQNAVPALQDQVAALRAKLDAIPQAPAGTPPAVAALVDQARADAKAKLDAAQARLDALEAQAKQGQGIPWKTVGLAVLGSLLTVATGIHVPMGQGMDWTSNLLKAGFDWMGAWTRRKEDEEATAPAAPKAPGA